MEECKDRLMCSDCVTVHKHSHLHKLMPLKEFND